jgi:peptidyl-prolyl cis-trans isomerase SurA
MKIRYVLMLLLVAGLYTLSAQDNVIDEVVWVVGDQPILRSEVEAQRKQAQNQGMKLDGDPYCVIPEQLAVQKLFLHQADLDSIVVPDAEIMSMVDRQINSDIAHIGSREKLEEYYEKPLNKIREMYRDQARTTQLIDQVKQKLVENVTSTPAEIRQYYAALPQDSIPLVTSEVEVEIITVEPQIAASEISGVKERLREFTDRVNKGESFSTLAVLYSEDRNTSRVGGETGFMGKGDLLPEFANVAFSLNDPKKVSKIVETEDGFHIIQLIEKRGDRINCRHILLKPEISTTEINAALTRLDSIADVIRNQKMTFGMAAQFYSYDKDTRNNGGLMVNARTGSSRFSLEELPQEIGKKVYAMNVGEISQPFTVVLQKDKREKTVCAIVRVKTKTKAHKANLTDDFQLIRNMLLDSKRNTIVENWIREKQKKTYVRINEKWSHCEFRYPGWIKK